MSKHDQPEVSNNTGHSALTPSFSNGAVVAHATLDDGSVAAVPESSVRRKSEIFTGEYWASMVRNAGMVQVPEAVAHDPSFFQYLTFYVGRGDGTKSRARIHQLGSFRDGSAVVKIVG